MNLTPKRIIRFILGALLPVPLFVGIYYFSYFYTSYHGFDHESKTYMTSTSDIEMTRHHLKTDGAYDSLLVVAISCGVGGLIPLLMALIRSDHPIQKDRENKPVHPTAGNVPV